MAVEFYREDLLPNGKVVLFFTDERREDSLSGWESHECIIKGAIPPGGVDKLRQMIIADSKWYNNLEATGYECYSADSFAQNIVYRLGPENYIIIYDGFKDIRYYYQGHIVRHNKCSAAFDCYRPQSDTEDVIIEEINDNEFYLVIGNSTRIGCEMKFTVPE